MKPETDDERLTEMDDADYAMIEKYLVEGNSKEDLVLSLLERFSDDELAQILIDAGTVNALADTIGPT